MDPEILIYDHTIQRFLSGDNLLSDVFIINLYSDFVFNADAATKAAAEVGATQLPTLNGYTQDSAVLASKAVTIYETTNALFTAAPQAWTPSGGSIAASWAMCYNDTDTDSPPIFAVDFKGTQTALDLIPFVISWPAEGIIIGRRPVI